jgi:hypothetical protein
VEGSSAFIGGNRIKVAGESVLLSTSALESLAMRTRMSSPRVFRGRLKYIHNITPQFRRNLLVPRDVVYRRETRSELVEV